MDTLDRKLKITALCFVVVFLFTIFGCKKSDATLAGEWDLVKFAYTTDGKKISNEAIISNCSDCIVNVFDAIDNESINHDFSMYFKSCNYVYSRSDNMIQYDQGKTVCFAILLPWTENEIEVSNALKNAYKFTIKGDKLLIYFSGEDNKNVLILKKR